MTRKRPTVADLRAMKGKRQLTMLRVLTLEEREAAERAGIDIVSVPPDLMLDRRFRDAAPGIFAMPGDNFFEIGTADDFVRWAFRLYKASADAVYCSAGFATVKRLADDAIPVIGHVGLIPSRATWTGAFARSARRPIPPSGSSRRSSSTKLSARSAPRSRLCRSRWQRRFRSASLFMISMGSGAGCDAQYLFADDVLGQNRDHMPRHSKVYRNFAAEHDRLQAERVAAFSEFVADVESRAYPEERHVVRMDPAELRLLLERLKAA